jgi:LysM repeat protein
MLPFGLDFGKYLKKNRGSLKDPSLYIGVFSVVLLGLVSFSFFLFPSIPSLTNIDKSESPQSLFLGPSQNFWPELSSSLLIQEDSLRSILPPVSFSPQVLGALSGGFGSADIQKAIVEYIVEPGDNLWSISAQFDITLDTILWANDLNKNSIIQSGQKLVIPPVSGVIHHVKSGDTISQIAQRYQAKTSEIITFNELSGEGDIFIGDILVVPGGEMPSPSVQYAPTLAPLAESYFICPIPPPCRITQGLHWYNAIDFSHGQCGEPIFAAAGGKVLKVKLTSSTSRWAFGGAGNHLTILHPNGVVTMYGHILKALVSPGQEVSQGQIIALMGGQPGTPGAGLSTGCHLHFGVSGAKNPFAL